MGQIAQTDGIEPEYVVECVVQTGRNQQTVKECIDAGADALHTDDAFANSYQSAEDDRPYEQQDNGYENGNQTGYDGNAALAAEECQPVRELRVFEAVIAACADDTGDDGDKYVLDLVECQRLDLIVCDGRHERGDDAGAQQVGHHQPGNQTGESGCTVSVIGQTDRDTDNEQPSHVVDQRAARLDEQEADVVQRTAGRRARYAHNARGDRIAEAHQNTADRERCYRQHECLT